MDGVTAEYYGIPTLDVAMQATEIVAPVMKWGTVKRGTGDARTVHFYADDRKFNRLWFDASKLIEARPTVVTEPNFSIHSEMPRWQAIERIAKKRTLACEWQAQGIEIIVDLNTDADHVFRDIMLLGVPRGWNAYATRIHRDVPFSVVEAEHAIAVEHSGRSDPFFVLFGGGQRAQKACGLRGWQWVPEHRDVVAGRVKAYG